MSVVILIIVGGLLGWLKFEADVMANREAIRRENPQPSAEKEDKNK